MTGTYEHVLYERRGLIAYLTMNRPEVLNALNHKHQAEIEAAKAEFAADLRTDRVDVDGRGERGDPRVVQPKLAEALVLRLRRRAERARSLIWGRVLIQAPASDLHRFQVSLRCASFEMVRPAEATSRWGVRRGRATTMHGS